MSDAVKQIRRQCIVAGMDPDEPLARLLVSMAEMHEETKRALADATQTIAAARTTEPPDAEETARRIGQIVVFTTERIAGEQLRAQRRGQAITLTGILLVAVIASAGLAFWGGSSWRGARMMDDCRAHQSTDPSGRHGCVIWLE